MDGAARARRRASWAESTSVADPDQPSRTTARTFVEERVAERARRDTAEQVQETCSFARAERLLGREYHGRFLIELLQNGADAWRVDPRSEENPAPCLGHSEVGSGRSRVRVVLGDGPCLLVANQGTSFPETAVIESLGHIGRSTKAHGEAIGHKGIGFKSVLEISLTPELYSGLQGSAEPLAIRFDPMRALALIRAASPEWDAHLEAVDDIHDPLQAVPVLRYPMWVDNLPREVRELADQGFDTVVRLPFDDALRPDPSMDVSAWLHAVRDALKDMSDEMLLLLGTFDRLEVVDSLTNEDIVIEPAWSDPVALDHAATCELVTVRRNKSPTSRWRLYRRTLPDSSALAGEIAVGLRCDVDRDDLVPAVPGGTSAPFHLFFPTTIGSGLPFLLHGYFEVNAARTGFYDGSAARNTAILTELANLVAAAVADTAARAPAAVTALADLLGQSSSPEDPHAAEFRASVLTLLDDVAWVPLEPGPTVPPLTTPTAVLVDARTELIDRIVDAFDPGYIMSQTTRGIPSRRIGEAGHRFLMERRPEDAPDLWQSVAALCRPGEKGAWPTGEEGARFRALLDLIAALDLHHRARAAELVAGLRGDPDAYLVPVGAADGQHTLLPVPDATEGVAGNRSQLVMARTRDLGGAQLIPPPALDVAFLPDGLLDSEGQVDRAKPLGVRDFTVDNVLNRLPGVAGADGDPADLLRFLWALLLRERRSDFSIAAATERASEFDPTAWFWCRPGHGGGETAEAERQRRRRLLSEVRLPARDTEWRAATSLAFGSDWADWLASGACGPKTSAGDARVEAYRALEAVRPSDGVMLASPDIVMEVLADGMPTVEHPDAVDANMRMHAFVLTLGVWELIPVEAFESREMRNREPFPWTGASHDARVRRIAARGGWSFGRHRWSGGEHQNVWMAEDFRFRWPLSEAAARDAHRLVELLGTGAPLYSRLRRCTAFCPRCRSGGGRHEARYDSAAEDNYPSILAVQLQTEPWVPVVLNGETLDDPKVASSAWWSERPPAGAGLRQSPLRYLPLCEAGLKFPGDLRLLAGIAELPRASLARTERLLATLRSDFEAGTLPVSPDSSSGARQAFAGLHRVAYERLEEFWESKPEAVGEAISRVGVLSDLGDALGHVSVGEARHDDGTFAFYRRYFTGRVPFVTLPRDRSVVAARLGIAPFTVVEERRPSAKSTDVTDELGDLLDDRIPELLAIVAHHSLGSQTVELGSQQFEERATRLRNLRVVQVDDLIIDVRVEGTNATATIGEGSDQDLFLEGAASSQPILYHDLTGEGWKDALRRKLAPHLAKLLENPAYSATFALFLLAESDAEREEALHELGITTDEVDAIRVGLGAVSDEERGRQRRWFCAIIALLRGVESPTPTDLHQVADELVSAGLSMDAAMHLVEHGGGEAARANVEPDGPLWLLANNGVELSKFDEMLKSMDPLDGLSVDVARRRLSSWLRLHRRRAAAALSTRRPPQEAKAAPERWSAPPSLRFALDPAAREWLGPVIDTLVSCGFEPNPEALAHGATAELIRITGLASAAELEARVAQLYDPEERARILRASAASWRAELLLLGILARTQHGDSRSAVRAQASSVDDLLPVAPTSPDQLRPALAELLVMHEQLAAALTELITNELSAPPDRKVLLALAREHGLESDHLEGVQAALEAPRRELAKRLRGQIAQLETKSLRPKPPVGMKAPPMRDPPSGKRKVPAVKVTSTTDSRKRRLGDDGERWALAAVLSELIGLSIADRVAAVDAIVTLLNRYEGAPVEKAGAHAAPACEPDLDEEELIDELTELLHVSRHSDGFGFDLLGWLRPAPDHDPIAMCLEVKSTRDGTFHLSQNEWARATWFHNAGQGERYAVLVVQRSAGSDPPKRLDLLPDPVNLVATGQLEKKDDGYKLAYRVS